MSQLAMRRPNLENLPPMPPLPAGYALRPCRKDEREGLAAVLERAFPGFEQPWTAEKARAQLLEAADVRETFVIEHGGKIVATASVQMPPGATGGKGTVHWVAADPAHKGLRLGYRVSLAVLHRLVEEGCTEADLSTDDPRLPAIKTYLNLGFIPHYADDTHPARWSRVFQAMGESGARGGARP